MAGKRCGRVLKTELYKASGDICRLVDGHTPFELLGFLRPDP